MGQRSRNAAIESLYASLVGATLSLALLASPAGAKGTNAGVAISNTATATYVEQGVTKTLESNPVTIRVQEILDVVVAPVSDAKVSAAPGETNRPFAFRITNSGNGSEAFLLSSMTAIAGDDFDPVKCSVALDANGNGTYEAGDTPYVQGSNDPVLAPDQAIVAFTLCDMPATLADGNYGFVDLYATARTKADPLDPKGTIYPAATPEGTDAVVGLTTARAPARGGYLAAVSPPSIAKSQAVADPTGGTTPVPGAEITYTLTAELRGGGITDAVVADPIPVGTSYVAGSLELSADGVGFTSLTDAQDGDAGTFTGSGVEVALGDAPATTTRVVRFKVRINQ